jgi:hypothetical protein
VLIAARVAGSLAARAAAVLTLRPTATKPMASIGPKQSGANSLTWPRPWSTSVHAPGGVLFLLAGGVLGDPQGLDR